MLLAQLVAARDVVDGTNWFQEHTGVGWTVAAAMLAVLGGGWLWFYLKKYRPLVSQSLTKRKGPADGPAVRGEPVIGHTADTEWNYIATINAGSFWDFRNDYDVALVSGLNDPSEDKYNDKRIGISAPFTITRSEIEIKARPSTAMIEAIRRIVDAAKAQVPIHISISMWQELVLLPKGKDISGVQCLADIPRFGGKILTQEIHEGRIGQTAVRGKAL